MAEKRINADCRYRATMRRTSPARPLYTLQPSRAFCLPFSLFLPFAYPTSRFTARYLSLSLSLLLYLFAPLALPKLIRPRESRGRRKSSRKFDCTRFATRALFYIQHYMSIGKSRETGTIVTNNAKTAFDTTFYVAVNWFALDSLIIVSDKLYSLVIIRY